MKTLMLNTGQEKNLNEDRYIAALPNPYEHKIEFDYEYFQNSNNTCIYRLE